MGQVRFGKVMTFLLVLVVTFVLVGLLSASTRVTPDAAAEQYIQQLQAQQAEPEALSAPEMAGVGVSWIASAAGFLSLMALLLAIYAGYVRSKRAERARQERLKNRRARRNIPSRTTMYRV